MNIKRVIPFLLIVIMVLMTVVVPFPLLAQEAKYDLIMTYLPDNYRDEVKVGEDNLASLELRNNGTEAVTNIMLSADAPQGWVVEFEPPQIGYLRYRSVQTVDVNIKPPEGIPDDTYRLTLKAEGDQLQKVQYIWVTVKTPDKLWYWVGAAIGVIVLGAFIFIYRRFGRS
jgi:uncharacterized membrane protein